MREITEPSDHPSDLPPFYDVRTTTSSCVVANGIPKSGTHLLTKIVQYFGAWTAIDLFLTPNTFHLTNPDPPPRLTEHTLPTSTTFRKLRNGQWVRGHLIWHSEIARAIADVSAVRNIKHIFIYRDPRDTFVSYAKFVTNSRYFGEETTRNAAEQKFMRESFSNDDERLAYVIETRPKLGWYMRYAPWLSCPHTFSVKFEELYSDVRATQAGTVGGQLLRLLQFLGVDAGTIDAVGFHDAVNGRSETSTDVVEKSGQYRSVFKEQHYRLLDTPEFRAMLAAFDYPE